MLSPVHPHELNAALRDRVVNRLRQVIVAGAAANTNVAVAGIATADQLISVLNLTDLDTPAGPTIFADGQIRLTETTAGDKLLVTYYDAP